MFNSIHLPHRLLVLGLTLVVAASANRLRSRQWSSYPANCVTGDGSVSTDCLQQSGSQPAPSAHDDDTPRWGLVAGIVSVLLLLLSRMMAVTQRPTAG